MAAALWHVRFDDEDIGDEDLELVRKGGGGGSRFLTRLRTLYAFCIASVQKCTCEMANIPTWYLRCCCGGAGRGQDGHPRVQGAGAGTCLRSLRPGATVSRSPTGTFSSTQLWPRANHAMTFKVLALGSTGIAVHEAELSRYVAK